MVSTAGYGTATSAPAQFVAALVLAAVSALLVVLLVAMPLRRVNFEPVVRRLRLVQSR